MEERETVFIFEVTKLQTLYQKKSSKDEKPIKSFESLEVVNIAIDNAFALLFNRPKFGCEDYCEILEYYQNFIKKISKTVQDHFSDASESLRAHQAASIKKLQQLEEIALLTLQNDFYTIESELSSLKKKSMRLHLQRSCEKILALEHILIKLDFRINNVFFEKVMSFKMQVQLQRYSNQAIVVSLPKPRGHLEPPEEARRIKFLMEGFNSIESETAERLRSAQLRKKQLQKVIALGTFSIYQETTAFLKEQTQYPQEENLGFPTSTHVSTEQENAEKAPSF